MADDEDLIARIDSAIEALTHDMEITTDVGGGIEHMPHLPAIGVLRDCKAAATRNALRGVIVAEINYRGYEPDWSLTWMNGYCPATLGIKFGEGTKLLAHGEIPAGRQEKDDA